MSLFRIFIIGRGKNIFTSKRLVFKDPNPIPKADIKDTLERIEKLDAAG